MNSWRATDKRAWEEGLTCVYLGLALVVVSLGLSFPTCAKK